MQHTTSWDLKSWCVSACLNDTMCLHASPRLQVGFLPHFLSLLRERVTNPANPLHGKVDLDALAAAGHSRGAQIAALNCGWLPYRPLCKHNVVMMCDTNMLCPPCNALHASPSFAGWLSAPFSIITEGAHDGPCQPPAWQD